VLKLGLLGGSAVMAYPVIHPLGGLFNPISGHTSQAGQAAQGRRYPNQKFLGQTAEHHHYQL